MQFATNTLAGLTSKTMVSRLSRVLKGYRVKIVEPSAPENHPRDMTLFVHYDARSVFEPGADDVVMI